VTKCSVYYPFSYNWAANSYETVSAVYIHRTLAEVQVSDKIKTTKHQSNKVNTNFRKHTGK